MATHPDDIEYGTASAVARWTSQGKRVTYLLTTRDEAGIDGRHPHQAGLRREDEDHDIGSDATCEYASRNDEATDNTAGDHIGEVGAR